VSFAHDITGLSLSASNASFEPLFRVCQPDSPAYTAFAEYSAEAQRTGPLLALRKASGEAMWQSQKLKIKDTS
jgi:hypothetical protein